MDSSSWGTIASFGSVALTAVVAFGAMQARSIGRLERALQNQAELSAKAVRLLADTIKESSERLEESSDKLDRALRDEIGELRKDSDRRLSMLEGMNVKWMDLMRELGERSARNEATLEAIARKVHVGV